MPSRTGTRKVARRSSPSALEAPLKGLLTRLLSAKPTFESKMGDPKVNSLTEKEAIDEIRWVLGGGKKFALFQALAKLAVKPELVLERLKPSDIKRLAESIVGPVYGVDLADAAMANPPEKAKKMGAVVDQAKDSILMMWMVLRQSRHPKIQLLMKHILEKLRGHPAFVKKLKAVQKVPALKNQQGGGPSIITIMVLLGLLSHVMLLGSGRIEPFIEGLNLSMLGTLLAFLKFTSGINPDAMYSPKLANALEDPPGTVVSAFKIAGEKKKAAESLVKTQEEHALAMAAAQRTAGTVMLLSTRGGPGGSDLLAPAFGTGFGAMRAAEQGASGAARSLANLQARSRRVETELAAKGAETVWTIIFGVSASAQEDIQALRRIYNETQAEIQRQNTTLVVAGGAPSITRAGDILAMASAGATQVARILASNPQLVNPEAISAPLIGFVEASGRATEEMGKNLDAVLRRIANVTGEMEDLSSELAADEERLAVVDAEIDRFNAQLSTLTDHLTALEAERAELPGKIAEAKAAAKAKWDSLSMGEARGLGEKSNAYIAWERLDEATKQLEARTEPLNEEREAKTREISAVLTSRKPLLSEQGVLLADIALNRAKIVSLNATLIESGSEKLRLEADLATAEKVTETVALMKSQLAAIADGDVDEVPTVKAGAILSYGVDPSSGELVPQRAETDLTVHFANSGSVSLFSGSPGGSRGSAALVSSSADYPGFGQLSTVMNPSLPMTGSVQEALGSLTALLNADAFTGAVVRASLSGPLDTSFGKKVVASFGGEGELSVPGKVLEAAAQLLHTELKLEEAEQAFESLETADSHMKQEAAVRIFKTKAREITDAYMATFGPAYPDLNRTTVEGHVNHFLTVVITQFQAFPKADANVEIAAILDTTYIHPPKERPSGLLTHDEVMFQMNINKDEWSRVLYRLDKGKWDLLITGLLAGLGIVLAKIPTGFAGILSGLFENIGARLTASTARVRAQGAADVAQIERDAAAAGQVVAAAAAPAPTGRPRTGSRWGPPVAAAPNASAGRAPSRSRWGPPVNPPSGSIWGPGSPLTMNQQVALSARIAAAKLTHTRTRAGSNGAPAARAASYGGGRKTRKRVHRRRASTRRAKH